MISYIQQLHRLLRARRRPKLGLHIANLSDLFFVFKLMHDGRFEGSFTDAFIYGNVRMKLLQYLLPHFIRQSIWHGETREVLLVISKGSSRIGLMHLGCEHNRVGAQSYGINMLATLRGSQTKDIAIAVIGAMIDMLTNGSTLMAKCNRYSSALKKSLTLLSFERRHDYAHGLTLYTYEKSTN